MKLDDQDFKGLGQGAIDFKDQLLELANFGKFQFYISSSVPTYSTNEGEIGFLRNGTDGRLYVRMGSSWNLVASFTADAS